MTFAEIPYRKRTVFIPYLISFLFIVGCSSVLTKSQTVKDRARNCTHFRWASDGINPQAALIIPGYFDSIEFWFQLDTGLDESEIYSSSPLHRSLGRKLDADITLVSEHGDPFKLKVGSNFPQGSPEKIVGSIGLKSLIGYSISLDFIEQTFCLYPGNQKQFFDKKAVSWTAAKLRNNKFFVPLRIGDDVYQGFLYDSGASQFEIVTDIQRWKNWTASSEQSKRTTVMSWGEELIVDGKEITKGRLRIADLSFENSVTAYYIPKRPKLFEEWPFPAQGLIGNKLFMGRSIFLIIDPQTSLFGIQSDR